MKIQQVASLFGAIVIGYALADTYFPEYKIWGMIGGSLIWGLVQCLKRL